MGTRRADCSPFSEEEEEGEGEVRKRQKEEERRRKEVEGRKKKKKDWIEGEDAKKAANSICELEEKKGIVAMP